MAGSSHDLWSDEVGTAPGSPSAVRVASEPPSDPLVALGQLMANVARLERKVDELRALPSEVAQLRRDVNLDRGELVNGTSRATARHVGNRIGMLMVVFLTAYEVAAPYLRALAHLVRK